MESARTTAAVREAVQHTQASLNELPHLGYVGSLISRRIAYTNC